MGEFGGQGNVPQGSRYNPHQLYKKKKLLILEGRKRTGERMGCKKGKEVTKGWFGYKRKEGKEEDAKQRGG